MVERAPEDIIAEMAARSRRFIPFLIVGLLLIFASLVGSVIYLNELLEDARAAQAEEAKAREAAEDARRKAEGALQTLVDAARGANPGDLVRAVQLATGTPAEGRPPQIPLDQLEVQILVCTGSAPRNSQLAEALRVARPGGIPLRERRDDLSEEGNARPNYRLQRNEIRYNPAEEEAADRLQAMVRELGSDAAKVLTFFPTPNSISVFFCEGANPPPLSSEQADEGAASNLAL